MGAKLTHKVGLWLGVHGGGGASGARPSRIGVYSGRLRNRLFGLETGFAMHWPVPQLVPGLGVKIDMKVGLVANAVRNEQLVTEDDATGSFSTTKRRIGFASMAESGLQLTYEPYPNVLIHGGYRFMWFNGVATAPNNAGNFGGVNTSGSLLMHGPNVGVTVRFGDFRPPAGTTSNGPGMGTMGAVQIWAGGEYVFFRRNTEDNRLLA